MPAPTAVGSAEGAPPVRIVLEDSSQTTLSSEPVLLEGSQNLDENWTIQVGAFATRAAAQARLSDIARSSDARVLLADARPVTEQIQRGERILWRAQFDQLDASKARSVCARLAQRGQDCFALSPRA